jgi:predicted MFS family arabinose efflux permease
MALLLGMMISLSVTPFLTLSCGFEFMLLAYSAIAVIGAVVFLIVARAKPAIAVEPDDEAGEAFSGKVLRHMVRSRDIGLLSAAFFIGVGLFTALATWLEKILEPFGISITDAGIVGGVFIVGGIVGSIVILALSDKTGRRKPFLVGELLVSAAALMILVTGGELPVFLGWCIHIGFLLDAVATDWATGLGGACRVKHGRDCSLSTLALLSDRFCGVHRSNGISETTLGSFQYSILVLVVLDLVAAVLCSRITETGKKLHGTLRQ